MDYTARRRSEIGQADVNEPSRDEALQSRLALEPSGSRDVAPAAEMFQEEDVRILWLDYDEHQERFKEWREVT